MQRNLIRETPAMAGQNATVMGWVSSMRAMGKMIFFTLRDRTGEIQCTVLTGANDEVKSALAGIREESVISVTGMINARPANTVKAEMLTGAIEMLVESVNVFSVSDPMPFPVSGDGYEIKEELRLEYRYLDMRRPRVRRNIIARAELFRILRDIMREREFVEVDTPVLTKGTPEGAREYLIPSRNKPGEFYVLPQSPQQFKQLLMVGGIERYFQLARCFRDEDVRADRSQEFTQLDIEMSFVNREDVMAMTEGIVLSLFDQLEKERAEGKGAPEWQEFLKRPLRLQSREFPVLTFAEVMEKFHTDKPDLRTNKDDPFELAFCWVIDIPLFEYSEQEKKLVSSHHPFTMPHQDDMAMLDTAPKKVRSLGYDLVCNGYEVGGGSIRIHDPVLQQKIFALLGISEEEQQIQFGHLLRAFKFGVPPHGGIAPGLDRFLMNLLGEATIREVQPFPKTGSGNDLLMGAPSPLPQHRLDELHIAVKKESK